MATRIIEERVETHSVQKHEDVTGQDRERMTHKEITPAFGTWRFDELLFRHDRIRADL